MIKEFRASDGTLVWTKPSAEGDVNLGNYMTLSPKEADALREFFRHERDEELGQWRDTVDPSYFVIKNEYDRVVVVNERSSRWTEVTPKIVADYPDVMVEHQVGARYFAVHPVALPWHDAKPGEVWVVTLQGTTDAEAMTVVEKYGLMFSNPVDETYISISGYISAAHRIFPEASNG